MRRAAHVAVAAVTCLSLAAGACAAGTDEDGVATLGDEGENAGPSPQASVDVEQALVDFAECMREQGIEVETGTDAGGEGNGIRVEIQGDVPFEKVEEADAECRHLLPEENLGEAPSAEEQEAAFERALAFAECMREQGVDWPDPERAENGGILMMPGEGADPDDPAFQEAEERCRPLIEAGTEEVGP